MSKTFQAISVLIGTVIGAGILGIPFVVMRSGFGIGLLNMILVMIIIIIAQLYLAEIALRTKKNHQLTGYAELYLGKKGKIAMLIAFTFGIYSALLAYLIGEGESLSYIFFNTTDCALLAGILFWAILSVMTYFGLRALKDGEELGLILIIVLIISLSIFFINKIEITNLTYNNPSLFFFPFGVILFAFLGLATIPEIERILKTKEERKLTKKVILISNLAILAIYIIFTAIVLGSQGQSTPSIATLSLGKPFILLGIITMFTSYLALSIALVDMFKLDYNKSNKKAWLYTISIPLIIYLFLSFIKSANFTKVLGIGGVISGGLMGILILLMIKNAKLKGDRKPEFSIPYSNIVAFIMIALLIIGAILEIINVF
jgi:amino acid permease